MCVRRGVARCGGLCRKNCRGVLLIIGKKRAARCTPAPPLSDGHDARLFLAGKWGWDSVRTITIMSNRTVYAGFFGDDCRSSAIGQL